MTDETDGSAALAEALTAVGERLEQFKPLLDTHRIREEHLSADLAR